MGTRCQVVGTGEAASSESAPDASASAAPAARSAAAARGDAAEPGEDAQARDQQARHPGAAVDGACRGGCLAAAVAAEDDVVGQQLLQPLEIAVLGGREEAGRMLLALRALFIAHFVDDDEVDGWPQRLHGGMVRTVRAEREAERGAAGQPR